MKTLKFIGLLLISFAMSAPAMAQTETKNQLVIPLSDPGKPFRLDVDIMHGSIDVMEYDGKDIVIEMATDESKQKPGNNVNGMRLIGRGSSSVTATEKNNHVSVTPGALGHSSNLKIKVPKGADIIKLSTVNSGGVTATDISGSIEVNNTNGGIKLINVSGSVVANTTNGNITVVFKSVDPKAAMAFSTFNGKVDVTLPATLKANVKLHTDRGDVLSDFDVAVDPSAPTATKTKDGAYRFGDQEWRTGKIAGGGPELMMKTFNGNIYIRKAK